MAAAGSYWNCPLAALMVPAGLNHVEAALNSQACTMEDLIEAEDLYQTKSSLIKLVELSLTMSDRNEKTSARLHKYPFYACEVLCAENGDIAKNIADESGAEAMELLWDFLAPFDPEESLFLTEVKSPRSDHHSEEYTALAANTLIYVSSPVEPTSSELSIAVPPYSSTTDYFDSITVTPVDVKDTPSPQNSSSNSSKVSHHASPEDSQCHAYQNPVLMEYFCRIISVIYRANGERLSNYLRQRPWRLRQLLNHISSRPVAELVVQFLRPTELSQVSQASNAQDDSGRLFPVIYVMSLLTTDVSNFLMACMLSQNESCVIAAVDILGAIISSVSGKRLKGFSYGQPMEQTAASNDVPFNAAVPTPLVFGQSSRTIISSTDKAFLDVVMERNFEESETNNISESEVLSTLKISTAAPMQQPITPESATSIPGHQSAAAESDSSKNDDLLNYEKLRCRFMQNRPDGDPKQKNEDDDHGVPWLPGTGCIEYSQSCMSGLPPLEYRHQLISAFYKNMVWKMRNIHARIFATVQLTKPAKDFHVDDDLRQYLHDYGQGESSIIYGQDNAYKLSENYLSDFAAVNRNTDRIESCKQPESSSLERTAVIDGVHTPALTQTDLCVTELTPDVWNENTPFPTNQPDADSSCPLIASKLISESISFRHVDTDTPALPVTAVCCIKILELVKTQALLTKEFLQSLVRLLFSDNWNSCLHVRITEIFQSIILEFGLVNTSKKDMVDVSLETLRILLSDTFLVPGLIKSCICFQESKKVRKISFGTGQTIHLLLLATLLFQETPNYPSDVIDILTTRFPNWSLVELQVSAFMEILKTPLGGSHTFTHFADLNSQKSVLPLGLGGASSALTAVPAPPPMIPLTKDQESVEFPTGVRNEGITSTVAGKDKKRSKKRQSHHRKKKQSALSSLPSLEEGEELIQISSGFESTSSDDNKVNRILTEPSAIATDWAFGGLAVTAEDTTANPLLHPATSPESTIWDSLWDALKTSSIAWAPTELNDETDHVECPWSNTGETLLGLNIPLSASHNSQSSSSLSPPSSSKDTGPDTRDRENIEEWMSTESSEKLHDKQDVSS